MKDIFEHNFYEMTSGRIDASLSFEPRHEKTFVDYTTYYANVRHLPKDVMPISIAGKAPDGWKGLEYKKLAPKKWFFDEWKKTGDNDFYVKNFKKEVLDKLNPKEVWEELRKLSGGAPFALVCYEKPTDFCHRHLVAEWLDKNGYKIEEFMK